MDETYLTRAVALDRAPDDGMQPCRALASRVLLCAVADAARPQPHFWRPAVYWLTRPSPSLRFWCALARAPVESVITTAQARFRHKWQHIKD